MNLVELLLEDHRHERELFQRVRQADQSEREDAFCDLVQFLIAHETAESLVFYPVVSRFVRNGDALAKQRMDEHHAHEVLLERLQRVGVDDPAFPTLLDALAAQSLRHAREEEALCVPVLEAQRANAVLARLGERFRAVRDAVPLHRHPHDGSALRNFVTTPVRELSDEAHRLAHLALTPRAVSPSALRGAA